MKNLCGLLFFVSLTLLGQTEPYVNTLKTFQEHYNDDNSQAIFDMMDQGMQEHLGIENFKSILATFREHLGDIHSYQYVAKEGFTETYETTFENSHLNIALTLHPNGKINGLQFLPTTEENSIPKIDSNITPLSLPFKGKWYTLWGGDTKAQNYHVLSKTQRYGLDFIVLDKNDKSYQRSGTRNEDYYAFGKPIYAVCDAVVYRVKTGVEDNRPGIMNPSQELGNHVVLKTPHDEYIVYGHLENETIRVTEGDAVKRGQYLGNCGNSGDATEPHLHFHIQDGPNDLDALGVKCYFESLWVNGSLQKDFAPIKGDRITRPKE
ncbi:MAG: peptidoglycan DD-metalloendopeptidase family protein [Flavobacteriaceae bacterium]|nr:peptidoglycan DD-metalloendopeptidase family protein [Flavobacteriaceae bacterium]